MYRNRLFLGISVLSLLLMSVAIFNPFPGNSSSTGADATDFYQRHPDWTWQANRQYAMSPVTGDAAFPDYYQRHPELTVPSMIGIGASDYFQRHPELSKVSIQGVGASDYFQRHPELTAPAWTSKDLTDYYFRQQIPVRTETDSTDYYFRHINDS